MFSVHGSDGTVYGPVDTATVRAWIAQGRVTPDTILVDAVTDRQAPARDVMEVADAFATAPRSGGAPSGGSGMGAGYAAPPSAGASGGFAATMGYNQPASSYPAYAGDGGLGVSPRSKVVAILLAFFLGSLGVHRFYLGYTTIGLVMLLFSIFTCFIGTIITGIVALVDLILIATGGLRDFEGRELAS